ncbi:CidA/LrgA family protein [Moraxella sp. VT-16-12]|uniref:CidA/LrgA family protein n=1 Tax=Moraxella sp. VT-16-12 TaxID=2014877 RepID=UPI000B7EFF40|nr:CidA/LrgA family protein [Moraxella sp. VT-16-12]TWV83402.1 CidA/LrgA family protein [Moraxella sp. VT-16-12]
MILKAFLVIFGCLFLGQIFIYLTNLPLPPSVIGLLILFGALQSGVVKLKTVQTLAKTLLDYLVLMVVPACISIMQYLDIIRRDAWVLIFATLISTFLVLVVTGKSYEWLRIWQKRHAQQREKS